MAGGSQQWGKKILPCDRMNYISTYLKGLKLSLQSQKVQKKYYPYTRWHVALEMLRKLKENLKESTQNLEILKQKIASI